MWNGRPRARPAAFHEQNVAGLHWPTLHSVRYCGFGVIVMRSFGLLQEVNVVHGNG